MSDARKVWAVAVLVALAWAVAPVADAQPPIRTGAAFPQTGLYASLGQSQLRGYQLCVKHMNEKGGVLGPYQAITDSVAHVLAAKKGLKTVALINADDLGGRAMRQGGIELAKKKGLQVLFADAYRLGTTDFSPILTKVRAANPDVLGVATSAFEDGETITRQMKALNVNPRMVGMGPSQSSPKLYEVLGRDAEFVYVATTWLPELVEVRAGGLIPIAREYPGAREFVESSTKEFPFPGASPTGYGACQVLVEAVRRAGSLDGAKVRDAISKMDYHTVFGRFRVDRDGVQIGHKMLLVQWQDGKRAIVWPEELAPSQPRFPTPPWNQRP